MEQRRRQAAEALLKHSLFGFQVHDAAVAERLRDLQELLLATCAERDQVALLSENVREIEEQLKSRSERFLLDPLRRFEQEMELLLDVGSGDEAPGGEHDEDEEDDGLLTDDDQVTAECWSSPRTAASSTPLKSPAVIITKQSSAVTKRREEEEVLCGVCCAPDSLENDPIVICEVCGVAVHQTCYRLAAVPEGDWYCHPCRQYQDAQDIEKNLIPTHELECEACCAKAGAMTPTIDGGWVHVACSMFLPELYVQDKHASRFQGPLDDLQVVCGVDKLKPRRRLRCCFCKKSNEKGACAQCAVGKCVVAYHALCALRNGIKLRYMEDRHQFGSGCLKHQPTFLKMDGEDEVTVPDAANSVSKVDKPKDTRTRKSSWSDEDESESDGVNEDDNELDSDSDNEGSQDSLSDDDRNLDEKIKPKTQPSPTKMSPPRLLGGPPLRKNGKKSKRSRQIKLSFLSAVDTPSKFTPGKTAPVPAASVSSNPVPPAPAPIPVPASQQGMPVVQRKDNVSTSRVILQSSVFAPAFYPSAYKPSDTSEQDFEYVMVLITSRPFGVGVASPNNGSGIFLLARNTSNHAILEAIDRGVIQNGDEIFAINDQVLRNMDTKSFQENVVPSLLLPARCWFRTKRKSKVFSVASSRAALADIKTSAQSNAVEVAGTPLSAKKQTALPYSSAAASAPGLVSPDSNNRATQSNPNARGGDVEVISLGIDWPWVFLRSDGKLAMNLFWKSLDSAFFARKMNKRTFSQLQEKVEDMSGVRLSCSHPEYERIRDLLVMPRRERVPAYLVEFRKTRKEKQTFLSSDIIMGVSSESKDAESKVDEQTALAVGTTVTVAKRTWPGMNKLGGVGRIKKVNEATLPDGTKRFTYNIAYVVAGGFEKNVERKYISVVDLDAEESEKNESNSSTATGRRQKAEPEPDANETDEVDASTLSVRLAFTLNRTSDEESLAALPDANVEHPPKKRRFQLQFSTSNATVYCERKTVETSTDSQESDNLSSAKELLLHRHFDVKLPKAEALTNECFSSELLHIEDRVGDEVDEDDTDSEGEADEIKAELATLQDQFRVVMEANELAFASLTKKVEEEYASKGYRQQELQYIQWRNYERMYQELQAAKRQFDDSDDDCDSGDEGSGAGTKVDSVEGEESEPEDVSFGGMFVNKLKQEGSEVCALCELSGGDFTGTDAGSVVHPQCAMFTPETFFKDGVVHGIGLVDPERRNLKCSICGGKKGLSKIQCANRKCVQAFHVACAFVNGLLTRDPYYQAWCPRHLKTSGMGQFVELPDHLNKHAKSEANSKDTPSVTPASSPARRNRKNSKRRTARQRRGRNRQDSTPTEATTAARADISSSKTNRKRKRKGSNASLPASLPASAPSVKNAARGNRGGSPRSAVVIEDQEPRCARRLEIDEVSDDSDHEGKAVEAWHQGRDTQHVFVKNDVVEVLAREWRGMNKPGGVARVRGVEIVPNQQGGKDVFYDVSYILGTCKEKCLPARFVRGYNQSSAE